MRNNETDCCACDRGDIPVAPGAYLIACAHVTRDGQPCVEATDGDPEPPTIYRHNFNRREQNETLEEYQEQNLVELLERL